MFVFRREAQDLSLLLSHHQGKRISCTSLIRPVEQEDNKSSKYQLLPLLVQRCSSSTMLTEKILNSLLAWTSRQLSKQLPMEEDKSSVVLEVLAVQEAEDLEGQEDWVAEEDWEVVLAAVEVWEVVLAAVEEQEVVLAAVE